MSSTSPVSSENSQAAAAAGAPYSHIGQLDPRFSHRLTCHKCGTCQAGQVLRAGSDFFDCLECGSFTYVKGINKNAHREAARLAAPAASAHTGWSGGFVFVCRAWGESDSPITELALDFDGVGAFMVSCWLGEPDAVDHDGTPTLPRLMEEWKAHDWTKTPLWSAEFEIGGVSAERVALPCSVASPATAEPGHWRAGVAEMILHLHQWQAAPAGDQSTRAWDRLQATIDALATPAAAVPAGIAKELLRLADIMRDCSRVVSSDGNAERILRAAAQALSRVAAVPPDRREAFATTMRTIYGNEFPKHPNSAGEYPGWADQQATFDAGVAFAAAQHPVMAVSGSLTDPRIEDEAQRQGANADEVAIVRKVVRALATGSPASAEWDANPDGILPGQDSPIRMRADTGAWEEHDAPPSVDPGVCPQCQQPWRGFCACGEPVAAQAEPIKFKTLLTGGKFRFKVGGPVFVRDKSFFRTLPDGDNGRSFPADMDAAVYPVPDTTAAATPAINCDICGFPTQGASRHSHCSNVD